MRNDEFAKHMRRMDARFNWMHKFAMSFGCLVILAQIAIVACIGYVLFNPHLIGEFFGSIVAGFESAR